MNWTSRKPIDGVWCLVRTINGTHLSAVFKDGCWRFANGREVDNVTHWIVYPEYDAPYDNEFLNNDVPIEIVLKYIDKERKNREKKCDALEKAYRNAASRFDKLLSTYNKMKADYKSFINEQSAKINHKDKQIVNMTAENTKLQNDLAAAIYQNDMLRMQLETIEKFG